MACKFKRDKEDNIIGALAPNEKESILFNELKRITGNINTAKKEYDRVRSDAFKKWFGVNWEKSNLADQAIAGMYVDKNGEPIVFADKGRFVYMNKDGKFLEVPNAKITKHTSGMTLQVENNLTSIAFQFVKEGMNKKNFDPTSFFNPTKDKPGKGILADEILMQAFRGIPQSNRQQARELFAIYKKSGFDAMLKAMPAGVTFNPAKNLGRSFLSIYDQWNDVINPITGNVDRVGWRTRIQNRLDEYGYKLIDDKGEIAEIDETPVRIHDISRLQEDPLSKLSRESRSILSNIPSTVKVYGYTVDMDMADVYSTVSEATVGQTAWSGMVSQLENIVRYKPTMQPILDKLKKATVEEKAALFANFANSYKNFLLFKATRQELYNQQLGATENFVQTQMFSSNQSNIASKSLQQWNVNSKEYDTSNPRALYKVVADETTGEPKLVVSKQKKNAINNAFNKIEKSIRKNRGQQQSVPEEAVEGLGEFLWELGIDYGKTKKESIDNLKRYFELGDIRKDNIITGMPLFIEFMQGKGKKPRPLRLLKDNINKENLVDIYEDQRSIIRRLSTISHLFEDQPFGSFISGTGKQYWPINQPTPLDEFAQNMKSGAKADSILLEMLKDPFYSPGNDIKHTSVLLQALHAANGKARKGLEVETVDAYKNPNESVATSDYSNQSNRTSLIVRLNAYANNANDDFMKIAIPTQADRKRLDFVTIPRMEVLPEFGVNVTRKDIIEGLILQDLARIARAQQQIKDAIDNEDNSQLIEGYHYRKGSNPTAGNGSVFDMTQIFNLEDSKITKDIKMSDEVNRYLSGDELYLISPDGKVFQNMLDKKVAEVEGKLEEYTNELNQTIKDYKINLPTDVHSKMSMKKDFIKDFVFNDFVGRIEIAKLTRGGFAFAKDTEDFYKRAGLLNTPGTKLFLKSMTEEGGSQYGMMDTYNEITIKDFDFNNTEAAGFVANNIYNTLVDQGMVPEDAKTIADKYRSANKTDAQGFISIDMYRGIMMGMGQWDMKLDEAAYKREKAGLGYNRPIYPIKPYHEQLSSDNGIMTMYMNKNSYMVITQELAENMPDLENLRQKMRSDNIHVINVDSATKGARKNVLDLQAGQSLDNATIVKMDSSKLRLPQITPRSEKNEITFSRQIRKNIITNLDRRESSLYTLQGEPISGEDLYMLYQETIATNLKEDTKNLNKELKLTELENIPQGTLEYRDAKLEHLKVLRDRMNDQIKDRDLPQNYLNGLNIVPNGPYDWTFEVPLSFPNYQAKFEQIFFSIYNNAIFNQKIKGVDAVQIAELGGSGADSMNELKFYNIDEDSLIAEVKVKASTLGIDPATPIEEVNPNLLTMVGYRMPNQGKNSSLVMRVKEFLPESHKKAIMVPGAITVQQGADFDIDKLNLILPQTKMVDGKLERIQPDYKKDLSKMSREERDNIVLDIFESILTDPRHLEESVTPLDSDRLPDLAADVSELSSSVDYNNPLAEIKMEDRNKAGIALRGLWANQLAGRNVAQTSGNLTVSQDYAPIINYGDFQTTFSIIGQTRELNPVTGQFTGPYTDYNISMYLSAAVDAAKDAIQIDINDNIYTLPTAGLMLSTGVPVEDVVYFLSQPGIKAVIEKAKLEDTPPSKLSGLIDKAILEFNPKFDRLSFSTTRAMNSGELRNLDGADPIKQAEYLSNFKHMFTAGRQLQSVYRIITPDNLDNINEMSSISSWLETEERYLTGVESNIIEGAEQFVRENASNIDNPLNAIALNYRNIFDTMLNAAENVGFINNRPAFYMFKKQLQRELGKVSFTADQHKFIDKTLFLDLMTRPESPFVQSKLISKDTFNALYTNPSKNIITRLASMKAKYPKLARSPFISMLHADDHNQRKNTGVYLIKMDTLLESSSNTKNILSNNLLQMVTEPQRFANDPNNKNEIKEIVTFAKLLVANQIYTKGFALGAGTYIDIIPSDFFTTNMLFPKYESPVDYYKRASQGTLNSNYFVDSNLINSFVRNFGTLKPGGSSMLNFVKWNKGFESKDGLRKNVISFTPKDSRVWNGNSGYAGYFISYPPSADPIIFVRSAVDSAGVVFYTQLQTAGLPGKLNEFGVTGPNEKSLTSKETDARTFNSPNEVIFDEFFGQSRFTMPSIPEYVSKPVLDKIDKICKI